jgi:hypothetical protein
MKLEKLQAFIDAAGRLARMKSLAQRYQAAAKKDASAAVTLTVVINGNPVPPDELAAINRAVAARVRISLPQLLTAAIADAETETAALKAAAKAEYDALFV